MASITRLANMMSRLERSPVCDDMFNDHDLFSAQTHQWHDTYTAAEQRSPHLVEDSQTRNQE
eukprot:1612974-Pyramimonas_sp.AAC.1